MKLKVKFPCGYEFEVVSLFGFGINYYDEDGCPIHGKNCPNKKENEKK